MKSSGAHRVKILIVGYRKFSELINAVMPEFSGEADITIVESVASSKTDFHALVERFAPDVVASAGSNAAYLASTLSVPVIGQPVTDTDQIEALAKARHIAKRVHLFSYLAENASPSRLFASLPTLLDIDLVHHTYSTSGEAAERFLLAVAQEQPEVVVGPSYTCQMAEEKGLTSILVYSKDSAREMLRNAVKAARKHLVRSARPDEVGAPESFVIRSSHMHDVAQLAETYAKSPGAVLIEGESGTGKEHIAREIHRHSEFSQGPMVAVNCGSIPNELFESELFGYVEGAFTSSRRGGRIGLIEQANGGVFYLDEVGEMPLQQQVKLLRVLQEKRVRPLGGNQEIAVNFKLIAATNRDLRDSVATGKFRDDLYYRLNVLLLKLPPLRERADDIPAIAQYYLERYAQQYDAPLNVAELYAVVSDHFSRYGWPGNVRELQNFVERLVANVIRHPQHTIGSGQLRQILPELFESEMADEQDKGTLRTLETSAIGDAMIQFNNDKTKVAEFLGISATTLWRRLKAMKDDHNTSITAFPGSKKSR